MLLHQIARVALGALLLFASAGCGSAGTLRPTPLTTVTVYSVDELLRAIPPGSVRAVGYLATTAEGSVLSGELIAGPGDTWLPREGRGLWLGNEPPLPATVGAIATPYTLVEARGRLEGPASFGPNGRYALRLVTERITPLVARELSLAELIANNAAYEGQPVLLRGQILAGPEGAILVERIGPGGVPDSSALQVKLDAPPYDPAVTAVLQPAANPSVRFGPVAITGLWRGGRLLVLQTTAP